MCGAGALPPAGAVLYGPPGSGKTYWMKMLMKHLDQKVLFTHELVEGGSRSNYSATRFLKDKVYYQIGVNCSHDCGILLREK
jgi:Cdc6-like AAA superfamily ATPase